VRRIRLVFLLLGALLLVPMGLLVQRALESVALERRVSHRAVAERLFDEMERELSSILRAEEERPFAHYRADAFADAVSSGEGAATPSPLARSESPPYVAGYFQIDPDGGFSTPSSAVVPAEPSIRSGGRSAAPDAKAPRDLEALVVRALRSGSEAAPAVELDQLPGTTRDLEQKLGKKEELREADAAVPGKAKLRKQVSPYEALQELNKGALARSERQVKLSAAKPDQRQRADAPAPARQSFAALGAAAESEAPVTAQQDREGAPALAEIGAFANAPESAAKDDRSPDADEIFEEAPPGEPTLEVHPMVGRLIDDERLLLYRLVLLGDQGYRQGLVVNVPALFRWLDETVVGGSDLSAFVGRDFFTTGTEASERDGPDAFRYLHRFAEPFDALAVRLTLEPLPDVGGAGYLYAIAVLLLISGTAGLVALYRMVAVRVRYAERRNNFVAAVSHELKTPLTAIRMYGEMLRDGMVGDEDKRNEYYGTITAESERLTRLINNVLEFSRLEQGTREVSLVVGRIAPVVREAVDILEPHAREVGFRIEVEVDTELPPVRFDRDAVLQVVFNLVDNALKYARNAGDRVIAIRCIREGGGVAVAVRDRGPGVPARHLAKIFEPFYRGGDELTRTAKGTGIGLALVHGLAETMGAAVAGRNLAEGGFEVAVSFRAETAG
jgi:signal transduction histidine kinase